MKLFSPYTLAAALMAAALIACAIDPTWLPSLLASAPHDAGGVILAGIGPAALYERKGSYDDAGNEALHEIKRLLEDQGDAWLKWKEKSKSDLDEMKAQLLEIQLKAARPSLGSGGSWSGSPGERKTLSLAVQALIMGNQQKANEAFIEAKAMSVGSDPDGGYVVHNDISAGMTKVMTDISPIYRLARVIDVTGAGFEEPIDREESQTAWVGEATPRSDTTTPTLGMFTAPLHEIYSMPKASQTLLDTSSINVLEWLQAKVGEAFAVKEGTAFHTGDGVAKPRGILGYSTVTTADATRTWGVLQHVATGASGAFPTSSTSVNPGDVLVDVVGALKAQYRNGAVWLMNRTTAAACRKLKDAEGRHVWIDSLVVGEPSALLGYPVEIDEDMPDIAAGSLSIAFGNVKKAYTIVQKAGIKFLTDPYTDKPNVRLYAYRRVGGGVNNSEALKFLKFA